MKSIHQGDRAGEEHLFDLDEIARRGARRMLAEALEAEVEAYLEAARGEREERGRALVVRNGYANEREVLLGAAAVEVRPIESTFAPVRARTDLTKGPGSREAGLAMIFKLLEAAEGRWRRLNGSHLVALVRAGAEFENGEPVEGSSEEKDAA